MKNSVFGHKKFLQITQDKTEGVEWGLDIILSTKWRPDLGVTGNILQSIIGEYIRAIREEFHDL